MAAWRERWYLLSSLLLCAVAVAFGTLLYPLVLLFISVIALVVPLFRRIVTSWSSSSRPAPPDGSGA